MDRQTADYSKFTAVAVLMAIGMTLGTGARAAEPIVVTSSAELQAALVEANVGRRVELSPGQYAVPVPLFVPDLSPSATVNSSSPASLGPERSQKSGGATTTLGESLEFST